MPITFPDLTRFRNNEHNYFMDKINKAIVEKGADKLHISHLYPTFVGLLEMENDANKNVRKSEKTKKIVGADFYRDKIFRGTTEFISSQTYHYLPEIADAATGLKVIWDGYGNLVPKALSEETISIKNLLRDMRVKADYIEKVPGLAEWLDELEKANNVVDNLLDERDDENSQKNSTPVKVIRVKIDEVYLNVITTVNVFSLMTPVPAEITEFIAKHNATLKRLEDIVARRLSGKSKEKTENDDDELLLEEPETPETPVVEDKYPDAKEWTNMVDVGDFKLGDICFMVTDGVKKYYKMIEESNFNIRPNGGEGELGWEPLD